MELSNLKRDPAKVRADLKQVGSTLVTTSGCEIQVPEKYSKIALATLGHETYVLGICVFIVGDVYAVSRAPTLLHIDPDVIETVKIEEVPYYRFIFRKGSTVLLNTDVVQDNNLLYPIYSEFIEKGGVPWYFNYEDVGALFRYSQKYSGTRLGMNHAIQEIIAATITRDPKNLNVQYRHRLESKKDLDTVDPVVMKLNSVTYGATNTTAKLIGSYWEEGVVSALVNPSETVEPIEQILRQ